MGAVFSFETGLSPSVSELSANRKLGLLGKQRTVSHRPGVKSLHLFNGERHRCEAHQGMISARDCYGVIAFRCTSARSTIATSAAAGALKD